MIKRKFEELEGRINDLERNEVGFFGLSWGLILFLSIYFAFSVTAILILINFIPSYAISEGSGQWVCDEWGNRTVAFVEWDINDTPEYKAGELVVGTLKCDEFGGFCSVIVKKPLVDVYLEAPLGWFKKVINEAFEDVTKGVDSE